MFLELSEQNSVSEIRSWVVNYYGQNFYLTTKQRNELLAAKEHGVKMVQIDEYTLSTEFSWMMPVEELEGDRLSQEEEMIINKICWWMSKPVYELTMNDDQIYNYAVKVVKRFGSATAISYYEKFANGEYPSVVEFMSAYKQLEADNEQDIVRQSRIGTTNGFERIGGK